MSRKSSVGRRKTIDIRTASPKQRKEFFRLRNKAIREQEDKDFELGQKQYEAELKAQESRKKNEERKAKFKRAISKLNPFRKKENKFDYKPAEGEPPLRTGGWTGKRGAYTQARKFKPLSRSPNVVYVQKKIIKFQDLNLSDSERMKELDKAEKRIEQDPDMKKYYDNYSQYSYGWGVLAIEDLRDRKKFFNDAIGNYPKTLDQQNRFAVANFLVNKYPFFRSIIMESGADKSYDRWYRKYAEEPPK